MRMVELPIDTPWLVLVEGESDREALTALARRCGHDLERLLVEIRSIGGAHAIGRVLRELPPGTRLAGLCDVGEVPVFARALERAGRGPAATVEELERLGFFTCDPDLEGELIRCLGAAGVEAVLEQTGKLAAFRTFQKQPQWRGRSAEEQLRRFFGSSAGKIRHAPLLAEAVDPERLPRPLARLLAHVAQG